MKCFVFSELTLGSTITKTVNKSAYTFGAPRSISEENVHMSIRVANYLIAHGTGDRRFVQ